MTKTKDPLKALEAINCLTECLIDHAEFGRGFETPLSTIAAFAPTTTTIADMRAILGLIPGIKIDERGNAYGLRMRQEQPEATELIKFIAANCTAGVGKKVLLSKFCNAFGPESSVSVARQLRVLPGVSVRTGASNQVWVFGIDLAGVNA